MNHFENSWRKKIIINTKETCSSEVLSVVNSISINNPVKYTNKLIATLKNKTLEEKIKDIFIRSACHIPHEKLDNAKEIFMQTNSISKTRQLLEDEFKVDIKKYKNLSDDQVNMIIKNGWGLAGIQRFDKIIATKIPSMFHEYFTEEDKTKKKYYYCHCPRIRAELLQESSIDSIYCNCGGGFYVDIWEYITGRKVDITVLKNLFDGDDVCQFLISFSN